MIDMSKLQRGRSWRWSKAGSHTVEVAHHTVGGDNVWCVYLSVNERDDLFASHAADDSVWAEYLSAIPLHGGCTYAKVIKHDRGSVLKIGCDFNHIDDRLAGCGPEVVPSEVMRTAEDLNTYMQERGSK